MTAAYLTGSSSTNQPLNVQPQHPAVAQVFGIPEIVLHIFSFLNEDADKKSVVLVSRFFLVIGTFANFKRIYGIDSLKYAISKKSIETVTRLVNRYLYSDENRTAFSPMTLSRHALPFACVSGDVTLTKLILENDDLTYEPELQQAVRLALKNREFDAVMSLFKDGLWNDRFGPLFEGNWLICAIIEDGNISLLTQLLLDSRVDPSARSNFPLKTACKNGRSFQVELLLQNSRLKLSEEDLTLIVAASKCGDARTVKMLLDDDRIDFSQKSREATRSASQNSHAAAIKVLLTHSKTKDAFISDKNADRLYDDVLFSMSKTGDLEVVVLLLSNPNIRPEGGAPIRTAVSQGHPEVVKALLEAGIVDVSFKGEVVANLDDHPQVIQATQNVKKFKKPSEAFGALQEMLTGKIEDKAILSEPPPPPAPKKPKPVVPTEPVVVPTEPVAPTGSAKANPSIPEKKEEKTIFQKMFGFVNSLFSPFRSLFHWFYKKLF